MFNGIVEMLGTVTDVHATEDGKELIVAPEVQLNDVNVGESIAINGVCLTVTDVVSDRFVVTAVPETLRRTNLQLLDVGSLVNLERSLAANARISGHIVQGHVDTTAKILEITADGNEAKTLKIALPQEYIKYIVNKGYIALDGMSITVIEVTDHWFMITLIPHTQLVTIAKNYCERDLVNIEVDILGKYIEKLLEQRS